MGTRRRGVIDGEQDHAGGVTAAEAAPTGTTWYSHDNRQIACDEHRPLYGRIPWRRMSVVEVVAFRAELADILMPRDALCEVCRGIARRSTEAA